MQKYRLSLSTYKYLFYGLTIAMIIMCVCEAEQVWMVSDDDDENTHHYTHTFASVVNMYVST